MNTYHIIDFIYSIIGFDVNIFNSILLFFAWIYSLHLWTLYEFLDNIFQFLNALLVGGALFYAARQYKASQKEKADRERPFVYLDLEFDSGLCTMVIKNTGGSPAKNIYLKFDPDILIHNESINSLPVINGLPFLAPNKEIKMFIGSMMGESTIAKRHDVSLEYSDIRDKKYNESQIVDPSKYLGITKLTRKGLHEIAKSLENIAKSNEYEQRNLKSLVDLLEYGVNIREMGLHSYNIDQLLNIVKNTFERSKKDNLEHFPDLEDSQILLKVARDKLLSEPKLSKKNETLLNLIEEVRGYPFRSGYHKEYQESWLKLIDALNK